MISFDKLPIGATFKFKLLGPSYQKISEGKFTCKYGYSYDCFASRNTYPDNLCFVVMRKNKIIAASSDMECTYQISRMNLNTVVQFWIGDILVLEESNTLFQERHISEVY